MSLKKEVKTSHKNMVSKNQSVVPTCITIKGILQLFNIWKDNNEDVESLFKIYDLEKNIKITPQNEKSILEIKVTTEIKEEKSFQIKIQIYD